MQTITLQVHDSVFDKFQWLLSHFSKDEIDIIDKSQDFDFVSEEKMKELKQLSNDYQSDKGVLIQSWF